MILTPKQRRNLKWSCSLFTLSGIGILAGALIRSPYTFLISLIVCAFSIWFIGDSVEDKHNGNRFKKR